MFGVMEFMTFLPAFTSALIHAGPGAESLIEPSGAWQKLGTNLDEISTTQPRMRGIETNDFEL